VAGVDEDGSLRPTPRLRIPADALQFRVSASGGPGGQHANRAATRVTVSFDVANATCLSEEQRERLRERLGDCVAVTVGHHRSQLLNKRDASSLLAEKIARALHRPTQRRATKPTKASKERRLAAKQARSAVKRQRRDDGD
jgi:ribosome-associated protein